MARHAVARNRSSRHRRNGNTRAAALAGVCLALTPAAGIAQELRGEVFNAATLTPLPYSTVALTPGFTPRFTDDSGVFVFASLAPGSYRLVVRHIGYRPLDTAVVVAPGHALLVRAGLEPLAVELPPITVSATTGCTRPGAPDAATSPELAQIFDQLRENAARYRLLADKHPYRYWIARRFQIDNPLQIRTDTAEYRSDERQPYRPGRLVRRSGFTRQPVMTLPNLADLADPAFHEAHCFTFTGIETIDSLPHLRLEFETARRLKKPDVDGIAWLDARTHELRRLTLRLTRPGQADRGLESVSVTVLFGEILPSLVVPRHVVSVTTRRDKKGSTLEEQELAKVEFIDGAPGRR